MAEEDNRIVVCVLCAVGKTVTDIPVTGEQGIEVGGYPVIFFFDMSFHHHRNLPPFIRQVKAANAGLLLEGKEDCYRSSHITRFAKLEGTCRYLATLGLTKEHYIESGLCDFDKFVIYTDEQTDTDTLFPALAKDMDLIDRLGGIYEVVPKGYSKGTAIDFILKHFGLGLDDAYVFGDSSNDLAMFTYGKHTVALGHHDPVLDPYTEYVTDTVENDGLMKAMAHYGLI